jgi:hypothetical protein
MRSFSSRVKDVMYLRFFPVTPTIVEMEMKRHNDLYKKTNLLILLK